MRFRLRDRARLHPRSRRKRPQRGRRRTERSDRLRAGRRRDRGGLLRPIEIAPGKLVNLAEPAANLSIQGPFAAGDFVSLSFEFASGQITELNVPVVVNDSGYWAGLDASGGGE